MCGVASTVSKISWQIFIPVFSAACRVEDAQRPAEFGWPLPPSGFDFATSLEGSAHEGIGGLACGHTCSTLLSDGSILTAYGHYISKGIALIRWKLPAVR